MVSLGQILILWDRLLPNGSQLQNALTIDPLQTTGEESIQLDGHVHV
jgi:hypothetical protein